MYPKNQNLPLNPQQQAFVDFFCQLGNRTQAALKAGYSKSSAYSQGNRLMKDDRIKKQIATRLEELKSQRIAETKEILEYITSVMRGEQNDIVVMNIGKGRGITAAEKVTTKVAEKEKLKAAEMLAKINGLFKQEVELSGSVPIVINDDI